MSEPIDTNAMRAMAARIQRIVGRLCSEGTHPRMSVPVQPDDEDMQIVEGVKALIAQADEIDRLRAEVDRADARAKARGDLLRKAVAALEPFYRAVFNDNGDMTISGCYPTYDEIERGYFVYRRIDAELGEKADATG